MATAIAIRWDDARDHASSCGLYDADGRLGRIASFASI